MKQLRVSVVIPAYHSDDTIELCLEGLLRQTFQDFETVIVNSSGDHETEQIVQQSDAAVTFVQHPTRLLPHAARNVGTRSARGELLVFTDPDCVPAADWLEQMVAAHDAGHAAVGGSMQCLRRDYLERGVHLCKFWWALSSRSPGPTWILPTANALYARRLWHRIGPFEDDVFAGDAILSWRAAQAGVTPWFEPKAVVSHLHGHSLGAFFRERYKRGCEFGRQRACWEGWSRLRLLAMLILTPLLPMVVTLRAARPAAQSGCLAEYCATLPIQLTGHAAWSLGEAVGNFQLLMGLFKERAA